MDRFGGTASRPAGWLLQSVWSLVAAVASVLVGNACIVAGALFAMVWEVGASPTVGRALNAFALGLMVVSYSAVLVLVMRAVASRWSVPRVVWLALGVYPVAWGLLVWSSPGGPFAITPTIVTGTGAVLAWLLVQRRAGGSATASQRPLSPG